MFDSASARGEGEDVVADAQSPSAGSVAGFNGKS
jgi:hypothetical protein